MSIFIGEEAMREKRMDPRKQFSKWLARYGAIVWGLFLLAVVVLLYFQPEAAMACVYLVLIVTFNKVIDTIAYTDNSKSEKLMLAALDKTRMELDFKGVASNIKSKLSYKDGDGDGEVTYEETIGEESDDDG